MWKRCLLLTNCDPSKGSSITQRGIGRFTSSSRRAKFNSLFFSSFLFPNFVIPSYFFLLHMLLLLAHQFTLLTDNLNILWKRSFAPEKIEHYSVLKNSPATKWKSLGWKLKRTKFRTKSSFLKITLQEIPREVVSGKMC